MNQQKELICFGHLNNMLKEAHIQNVMQLYKKTKED